MKNLIGYVFAIIILIMAFGLFGNKFYLSSILLLFAGILSFPKLPELSKIDFLIKYKRAFAITLFISALIIQNSIQLSSPTPKLDNKPDTDLITDEPITDEKVIIEGKWKYSETKDKMEEITKIAWVDANDLVYLDFPYNGGSQGILTLRKSNSTSDVYFSIDKGQIDIGIDITTIRVKFDDEEPKMWSMLESSTNDRDILFFDNDNLFYKKLKTSKKLVLEVPFFQNGNQQFEFNTENLVWN